MTPFFIPLRTRSGTSGAEAATELGEPGPSGRGGAVIPWGKNGTDTGKPLPLPVLPLLPPLEAPLPGTHCKALKKTEANRSDF